MEYQQKTGINNTYFNDLYNKTQFAIKKDLETRTVKNDNTKYYHLGKRLDRPYHDIYEYKYGHTQPYKEGTSWNNINFRPYPTNEPVGPIPQYVNGQNNKIIDVSGTEISNKDLFNRVGRQFQ